MVILFIQKSFKPCALYDSFNPYPDKNRKSATPIPPNGVHRFVPIAPAICDVITSKIAIPRRLSVKFLLNKVLPFANSLSFVIRVLC